MHQNVKIAAFARYGHPAALLVLLLLAACSDSRDPGCVDGERRHAVIETESAPAAVGPYSQAILAGSTLYLAGQIGLDPASGQLVNGGIEEQTEQVMENLGGVLEAAGYSFGDVVQALVFLADMDHFPAMNAVYARYFPEAPPARATVEVRRIPLDALVEIQLTAVKPDAKSGRTGCP